MQLTVCINALIITAMNQEEIIASIEARAWDVGISINALCRQAGVHPTTFSRWKKSDRNPEPISVTLRSIEKIYDALAIVEAKSRRRARKVAA